MRARPPRGPWEPTLEAVIASTLAVAVAEIGDKTQLLALFLATRFRARGAIIAGIVVATLANHGLSAWLGAWLASLLPPGWLPWIVGGSFLAIAVWLLVPDGDGERDSAVLARGAFVATTVLFFLAEVGDKTQVATVVLAARYPETVAVVVGTTLGMLAANVPVVLAGRWIMDNVPAKWPRRVAFVLFVAFGIAAIASI